MRDRAGDEEREQVSFGMAESGRGDARDVMDGMRLTFLKVVGLQLAS